MDLHLPSQKQMKQIPVFGVTDLVTGRVHPRVVSEQLIHHHEVEVGNPLSLESRLSRVIVFSH